METTLARPPETVDGVRLLTGPGRGTTRATLSFRVGTIDEPVDRRGVIRLISRIACAAAGRADDVTIGFTVTSFGFTGDPATVAHEIGALGHSLRTLDPRILARLVGRAVAAGPQHSPEHSWLLRARYGPTGWGADTVPEYAVRRLELDTVQQWADTYFSAGNAVLAYSGELPSALRLPLATGRVREVTAQDPTATVLPAVRTTRQRPLRMGGVVLIGDATERTALALTARALRHRLDDDLRGHLGTRLEPRTGVLSLGPDRAHLALWAERADQQPARALDVAVRTLDAATERISDEEAHFYAQRRLSSLQDYARSSAGGHALLERAAVGHLTGVEWSLAAEKAELAEVTGELLTRQVRELRDTLLVLVPDRVRAPRPWPAADEQAPLDLANATRHRSRPAYGVGPTRRDRPGPRRLLLCADGLLVAAGDRPDRQVRWSELRLVVRYDDGRRTLVDSADRSVDLRPEQWLDPERVAAEVDDCCAEHVVVDAGPRVSPPGHRAGAADQLPAWVWAPLLLVLTAAVVGAAGPWWPGLGWLRVTLGVVGFVGLFVASAYAVDVWRTERHLRRPRPS